MRAKKKKLFYSPHLLSLITVPLFLSFTLISQLRFEAHRQRRLRRPQRHQPKLTQAPIHASADQTHADTVLPKPQATVAAHLFILFAVIEFFFFLIIYFYVFSYGFGGCGGGG